MTKLTKLAKSKMIETMEENSLPPFCLNSNYREIHTKLISYAIYIDATRNYNRWELLHDKREHSIPY